MRHLFITEIDNLNFPCKIEDKTYLNEILSGWKDQLSIGDQNFFKTKLLHEKISEEDFKKKLEIIISSKKQNNEIFSSDIKNDIDLGFLSILEDYINRGCANIEKELNHYNNFYIINVQQILISFKNHLLSSLSKISEKIIFYEFKYWEDRLSNRHYKYYFYNKYPLLMRYVNDEINKASDFLISILSALKNDWKKINLIINNKSLENLDFELGDRHNNGQSVTLLYFNDNLRLLYKPHCLNIDNSYSNFINNILNNQKKLKYRISTPKIIQGLNYGWQEYIFNKKTDDKILLKEYYYKTGVHLCLFYLLNGSDLHFENLISDSKSPMIIDMETLLSPKVHSSKNISLRNVTHTGLLPFVLFTGNQYFELGGLSNSKNLKSPFKNKKISLKEGKIIEEDVFMDESKNIPYLSEISLLDYVDEIIQGFEETYNVLIEKKEELVDVINNYFLNSRIRYIARDTLIYSHLLREAYHPSLMTDGFLMERHFDWLWIQINDIPYLERLTLFEKKNLLNFDIPYFYTLYDSKSIFNSNGEEISDFFEISSKENVNLNVENISEKDKKRQVWLIKASVISHIMNK
jgi:type 2 lantibiotic biosynthesis protein LanM